MRSGSGWRRLILFGALSLSCERVKIGDPAAVLVLDISPDGRYVGGMSRAGEVRVWNVDSHRVVLSIPLPGSTPSKPSVPYSGFAFRGSTGQLLFQCQPSKICAADITTGKAEPLFDYGDPEDRLHLARSSDDGSRIAIGTLSGRVMSFDAKTGLLLSRKPRDIWSIGGPAPIYLLEGRGELKDFLSATSEATAAGREEREGWGRKDPSGFVEYEKFRDPLWRGLVVWPFEGGEPHVLTEDLGDRVRADVDERGDRIAGCQEGGPRMVLDLATLRRLVDLRLLGTYGAEACHGIRFLDTEGRWVAIVAGRTPQIEFCRELGGGGWTCSETRNLRRFTSDGARPIITLPAKRWLFVGLQGGGVDWYEYDLTQWPRLELVEHLEWN